MNMQVELFPQASVALALTVVIPALNATLFSVEYASGAEVVDPLKV